MRLSFHGAANGVTGSCCLVECAGRRMLIDCGLFQGGREPEEENAGPFGFNPKSIDWLLLTHAHLDHCGRLPLLRKRGFRGEIIATAATRDLTRLVLLDAAHIQEEDARRRLRRAARRGVEAKNSEPLYTVMEALDCFDSFGRSAGYGEPLDLAGGVKATFLDAGHILGSASILLELTDGAHGRRILFSGDIGNAGRPLLSNPAPPPSADIVVMESTYGDRQHRSLPESIAEFEGAIRETFELAGNAIIPTFALERAQELLFYLRAGIASRRLPALTQVFLDSPMAISATELFRRHPESLRPEIATDIAEGHDPLSFSGLHFTRQPEDSVAINRINGGAVVMAGSGMCTGGRIRHHLKHNLWRPECSIIFVGFAAEGTVARQIIDGVKEVSILGETIRVRARIHMINGFSAHADQKELVAWNKAAGARQTFLVHGEPKAMSELATRLPHAAMPKLHESVEI